MLKYKLIMEHILKRTFISPNLAFFKTYEYALFTSNMLYYINERWGKTLYQAFLVQACPFNHLSEGVSRWPNVLNIKYQSSGAGGKIMSFIVATKVVASRPPERWGWFRNFQIFRSIKEWNFPQIFAGLSVIPPLTTQTQCQQYLVYCLTGYN